MRIVSLLTAALTVLCLNLQAVAEPYPLDYFAVRESVRGVEISPNGKYVALMQIPSKTGNPIIKVFETGNLGKKPYTIGGETLEVTSYAWVSDEDIVVSFRGKVRDKIEGFNQGVYESRLALNNIKKKTFTKLDSDPTGSSFFSTNFVNSLPRKPGKALVVYREFKEGQSFRSSSYYELDLKSNRKRLVLKGSQDIFNVDFDNDGNPRSALTFDPGSKEFVYLYRKPGDRSWNKIFRISENKFEDFTILGYVEGDPSNIYVRANNGNDIAGLWKYNVDSKSFGELLYQNQEVDISGLRPHSNFWAKPDTVVGVGYYKDNTYIDYFDTEEAAVEEATYAQLQAAVPNSHYLRITSRSQDGDTLIAFNVGPRDPGSYYLLKDGRLQYLGGQYPLLEAENLADLEYIQYPARDGKTIPGFITVPNGEPPFPLVVMPHGGPFVREQIYYDDWAQLLANNGIMVLQPQYRGSQGYGQDFYTSAFINGGQGGYKMQDDKDDGALYLVRQGLVDPDRMAFFGWSYGGYAALIAAARENQLYQCSIAGAAVADNLQQVNYYRSGLRGRSKVEQIRFWDDSISPIEEVAKVNIPLLLVHGNVDQRVPVSHANKYIKALKAAGIPHKYVELDGADHFSNTLFYRHKKKFFEEMVSFLKNDCGPGGL